MLSQAAECNMAKAFRRVSHILHDSSRDLKRVKQQKNMRYEENICQYCTRQQEISTLSLIPCCSEKYNKSFLVKRNTNLVQTNGSKKL